MTYLIDDVIADLNTDKITARQLVENCLVAIDDPDGEGQRAFISTYHDRARQQADVVDHARRQGWALPKFAGIPLSVKDLFDEKIYVCVVFDHFVFFSIFFRIKKMRIDISRRLVIFSARELRYLTISCILGCLYQNNLGLS